jgi:hypothetical protein
MPGGADRSDEHVSAGKPEVFAIDVSVPSIRNAVLRGHLGQLRVAGEVPTDAHAMPYYVHGVAHQALPASRPDTTVDLDSPGTHPGLAELAPILV